MTQKNSDDTVTCPLCSAGAAPLFDVKGGRVYRCLTCKHAFTKNVAVDDAEIYNESYFLEKHKNYFDHPDITLFKRIEAALLKKKGRASAILDVGCGTGNLLRYLLARGFADLSGVDLIQNDFQGIKYYKADIFNFRPEKKFDVVISIMNIEHIDDPVAYVKFLDHLMQDDGLLIINTIREDSLLYRTTLLLAAIGLRFGVDRLYDIHHRNHFSKQSLKTLCEMNGFESVESFSKNYPFASIDVPSGLRWIRLPLFLFSLFSTLMGRQMSQVQIFRKRSSL